MVIPTSIIYPVNFPSSGISSPTQQCFASFACLQNVCTRGSDRQTDWDYLIVGEKSHVSQLPCQTGFWNYGFWNYTIIEHAVQTDHKISSTNSHSPLTENPQKRPSDSAVTLWCWCVAGVRWWNGAINFVFVSSSLPSWYSTLISSLWASPVMWLLWLFLSLLTTNRFFFNNNVCVIVISQHNIAHHTPS